ncbi:MAG: HAMP domain-containing sensor histidine kinase [Ignavibacteria bacterium]|nr:HAMP domain-containing sensor histidine kinase [Ignavibacteria bacterium]
MKFLSINLSRTVKRNAFMIASAFFIFMLIFNVLLYFVITYQLTAVLDAKISHEIEHISSAFRIHNNSVEVLRPSEFQESDLVKVNDNPFFLQIYSKVGQVFIKSENIKLFSPIALSNPEFSTKEYFVNTETKKEVLRTGYRKLLNEDGKHIGYLQLSARRLRIEAAVKNILYYNILLLPFVLLIIILISIVISQKTFQPVTAIIETANRITAANLKERLILDADPNDELSKLKSTLNNLFGRLEDQIQQISAFSDNASHQLITPLTVINSELDFILKHSHLDSELRSTIETIKEQSDRMTQIIKSLLILAIVDKTRVNNNTVFNLNTSIKEFIKPSIQSNRVKFILDDSIYLKGNADQFSMALGNIIDNALKYSDNSSVTVTATNDKNNCVIKIIDLGIGIKHEDKPKIFDRFFRASSAEYLGLKGYGLGLSLAKSIINSMNGEIQVQDNSPQGSVFIISLKSVRFE